jgi:hypothetical protein
MEFDNHFGEIWNLTLNSIGTQFFSVSSDKSIRFFQQTEEQVIPSSYTFVESLF